MLLIIQDKMESLTYNQGEKVIAKAGGIEAYDRQARQSNKAAIPDVSKKLFKALKETETRKAGVELESSK